MFTTKKFGTRPSPIEEDEATGFLFGTKVVNLEVFAPKIVRIPGSPIF